MRIQCVRCDAFFENTQNIKHLTCPSCNGYTTNPHFKEKTILDEIEDEIFEVKKIDQYDWSSTYAKYKKFEKIINRKVEGEDEFVKEVLSKIKHLI